MTCSASSTRSKRLPMSELEKLYNEESTDTSYDHVLKYTGIFGGVQGLKMLVSFARNKLTVKFLGDFGMGLIGVYNSISEFLVSAANLGVPLNATQHAGELFDEGSATRIEHFVMVVRTWVLWTAILATLLCVCASPLLSYFFFNTSWDYHVLLMIPVAVNLLLAEGECAILKGLRQVRKVAVIEGTVALLTIALTIPFYYYMGMKGVILGLLFSTLSSFVTHAFFSFRLVSYKVSPFNRKVFFEGLPMVKRGIPYVLANISTNGLNLFIPAYILHAGSTTMGDVGLFRAGWVLMVSYAGLAFVALEADYFPRLSSVNQDLVRMNHTVNQQVKVSLLAITPLLMMYILFLPTFISLLFADTFLVIHDMSLCACFYTFLRTLSLPLGYSTLAKGDSLTYLAMEVASNIIFGVLIWWLYNAYGLTGVGIALSLGALYDIIVALLVCGYRYKLRIQRNTWLIFLFQLICLSVTFLFCFVSNVELKYFIGGGAFVVSLIFSLFHLSKRSDFLRHTLHHFTHSSGDCC